ncbi:MAG: hypothetical protein RBR82_06340 [Pseudomonas sp.]|nr:hypothetical protein [Pseudomonas sp.]
MNNDFRNSGDAPPEPTLTKEQTMNLKYRKKPVVIDAWQFTKANYFEGVPREFKHKTVSLWSQYGGSIIGGEIETLEGKHIVSENDWIIKGVAGEFYPCKPEIFAATYEAA